MREAPDAHVLVHDAVPRDERLIVDHDVSRRARAPLQMMVLVADPAVVGDVRVRHQVVVVADDRRACPPAWRDGSRACSRMTLRSPMRSPVGAPRYARSCGSWPMIGAGMDDVVARRARCHRSGRHAPSRACAGRCGPARRSRRRDRSPRWHRSPRAGRRRRWNGSAPTSGPAPGRPPETPPRAGSPRRGCDSARPPRPRDRARRHRSEQKGRCGFPFHAVSRRQVGHRTRRTGEV